MKHIKYFALSSFLALPVLTYATPGDSVFGSDALSDFLRSILTFINSVLIPFIFGVAFLLFVWGMFQYFIAGGANEEAREKGKQLLIWTILGFIIIIVFWGLLNLLAGATGLEGNRFDDTLIPDTPIVI